MTAIPTVLEQIEADVSKVRAWHVAYLVEVAKAAQLLAGAMSDSEAASIGVLQSRRRVDVALAPLLAPADNTEEET